MSSEKRNFANKSLIEALKDFLQSLKETITARLSTPTLHGVNLIQGDFSPSTSEEHPGFGIIDEIKPIK